MDKAKKTANKSVLCAVIYPVEKFNDESTFRCLVRITYKWNKCCMQSEGEKKKTNNKSKKSKTEKNKNDSRKEQDRADEKLCAILCL